MPKRDSEPSPSTVRHLSAALLLGAASGMRTFTPEAVIAARGGLTKNPAARTAIIVAAAGELVGDKLPRTPNRIKPLPYIGRVASGAYCGLRAAGPAGAVAAAAASAAATFGGYRARGAAGKRIPAVVGALIEDALAIGAASLGTALAPV